MKYEMTCNDHEPKTLECDPLLLGDLVEDFVRSNGWYVEDQDVEIEAKDETGAVRVFSCYSEVTDVSIDVYEVTNED